MSENPYPFKPDSRWKYFTEKEVKDLDYEFVELLDKAREISLTPYIITSAYRSPEHNKAVGGVEESSHTTGFAVDLRCDSSPKRFQILKGLFAVGLCRIGIYPSHIHVDDDRSKPQGVVWFGAQSK